MVLAILFNIYLGLGALGWLPPAVTLGIHSYWVGATVNGFFIMLALLLSFFLPGEAKGLEGLTVWTMPRKAAKAEEEEVV